MNTTIFECDSNGRINKLAVYSIAPEADGGKINEAE